MPRRSFDDWFDRELAELKAGLEKLEASLDPRLRAPETKPKAVVRPRTRAKSLTRRSIGSSGSPPTAAEPKVSTKPAKANARPAPAQPVQAGVAEKAAPAPAPAPNPPPPAAPSRPTGTDLADPKNFGMEPPSSDLERGASGAEDYRQRLMRHIAFATRVLHTSGVPAAVWREWRAFERTAQERLRELNARPPDPDLGE